MITTLFALYVKLNLLLVIATLLWLTTRIVGATRLAALDARKQLQLARGLFIGTVLLALFALFTEVVLPGVLLRWSKGLAGSFTDTVNIVAGATRSISAVQPIKGLTLNTQSLLLSLVCVGWLVQLARLSVQWLRLHKLISNATPWKQLANVHVLFSADTAMPFTTKALGRRHVVLPTAMLATPAHLRLALKHELQHLRQHDLDWLLALEAMKIFCWWNPVAYWWHQECDQLHELACDEALVLGRRVDTRAYGNCLIDVADTSNATPLLGASTMVPRGRWFGNTHSQLRKRIMKLTTLKKDQHRTLKTALHALLLGGGLLGSSLFVLAAEAPNQAAPKDSAFIVPQTRINPEYPQVALTRGVMGWVKVEFDINEQGDVEDPQAVESCAGASLDNCIKGDATFVEPALKAIAKWHYNPRIVDGQAVRRDAIQTLLRFQLEN